VSELQGVVSALSDGAEALYVGLATAPGAYFVEARTADDARWVIAKYWRSELARPTSLPFLTVRGRLVLVATRLRVPSTRRGRR
jgi:hypothetical protein